MSELIAVSNSQFEIEVTPSAVPGPTIATPNNGTATPTTPAKFGVSDCKVIEDDKCKVQGDKFLVDLIENDGFAKDNFSCAPLSVPPYSWNPGQEGTYTIPSTSQKVKCSTIEVMRENDSTIVNCSCAGQDSTPSGSGGPILFVGSCSVKISKAGQDVVKGE